MGLTVLAPRATPPADLGYRPFDVAVVNVMPDGAFLHAEQQFLGLVEAAVGPRAVVARLYATRGVPRGPVVAAEIARRYLPVSALIESRPPNILIVTGAAPVSDNLVTEEFYPDLRAVIGRATAGVACTLLSCLAAHAALLELDGIARVPLREKLTGVFPERARPGSQLGADLRPELTMPHSRWNDVPPDALLDAGYEVLAGSATTGWSVATVRRGTTGLLLLQGHPEYQASSLLREYRRDATLFTAGDSPAPPPLPTACVAPGDEATLARYHEAVVSGAPAAALPPLDYDDLGSRAQWSWRPTAIALVSALITAAAERETGTLRSSELAGG